MLDIADELDSIRNALSDRGIEFAVCGGMAMAIHGFVRATVDLDLFVRSENFDAVESAAFSIGYVLNAQRASKVDATDGDTMMLDLIVVNAENRLVWRDWQVVTWRDKPLSVVSREGLITLKRLRGSGQDLADIERLPAEEIDGSHKAIELRMKRLGQIRNLCLSLGKAGAAAHTKGLL